ncbi:MAG: very short patch repair endonuclease [Saprospiraceae bacterium]
MKRQPSETRSRIMRSIRNKGSKIEATLAKALWKKGYRYRRNYRGVYGTPDIVFTKYKLAIFCDSEFWHGKDWGAKDWRIRSNREFWVSKIEKNIARDRTVTEILSKRGYAVLRFWGEEILKNTDGCVQKVIDMLNCLRCDSQKKTQPNEQGV